MNPDQRTKEATVANEEEKTNTDPMSGDALLAGIVAYMEQHMPTKLIPAEAREPAAMEFVEMLGRLVEFLEQFQTLTIPKMAALLYFTEGLDVRRFTPDDSYALLKLVEGAKNAARKMRRAVAH
jgi:hypothetical protein